MTESQHRHIEWSVMKGVAVVRFVYTHFRDFEAYDEISSELDEAASAPEIRALLLNLDSIEHFTSRFLGIMAGLSKRLNEQGRRMAVCRVRPEPLRIFRLCRLEEVIPVYATEEEARQALEG